MVLLVRIFDNSYLFVFIEQKREYDHFLDVEMVGDFSRQNKYMHANTKLIYCCNVSKLPTGAMMGNGKSK